MYRVLVRVRVLQRDIPRIFTDKMRICDVAPGAAEAPYSYEFLYVSDLPNVTKYLPRIRGKRRETTAALYSTSSPGTSSATLRYEYRTVRDHEFPCGGNPYRLVPYEYRSDNFPCIICFFLRIMS